MKKQQYPEDSLVAQVGKRIRALRNEQGTSLRDFGKKAGVHPFHVMAIELGQLAANTRTLQNIAGALGVKVYDLLDCNENDDHGQLIEMMRKQPESVRQVQLRVKPE